MCAPAEPRCDACPLARGCEARRRGLQGELPRKRAKAAPRVERWAFARVVRDGAVLLERRGPGLLEGFWALPGARIERNGLASDALAERLADLGVRCSVGAPAARDRWMFTHRVWRFQVHPARLRNGTPAGARWVRPDELPRLPVAQPHRPHIEAAWARPRP